MKTLVRLLSVTLLVSLGSAAASASGIDLGAAAGYGILGLDGATINLSSGPLRVNNNVGIGDNGTINFSGGGQINGALNYSSSSKLNTGGNTISNGTHQVDFSAIQQAALAEASAAAALSSTQSFSSINSPLTINGSGAQNVIGISQNIHLSGGTLTIHGSASDSFIFNIAGTMELSGDTKIVLSGGVTPDQILFNFLGAGNQVQTSGNSLTTGIFLAPQRVFNINGGVHQSEFISGMSLSFQSNPVITPVPELSSPLLFLIGLGFLPLGAFAAIRRNRS